MLEVRSMPVRTRGFAAIEPPSPAIAAAQQLLTDPAALPGVLTPTTWAADLNNPTPADNEVLLAYLLDGQPLGQPGDLLAARTFEEDGEIYLPLQAVAQSLGFPIAVNAAAGQARGWFMNQARTLELDMAAGTIALNGQPQTLPVGSVRAEGNELYVAARELNRWFPVKFDVRASELTLYAQSTEQLPMAARLARQRQWATQSQRGLGFTGPRHVLNRPGLAWPDVRLNFGSTYSNRVASLGNSLGVQARGPLGDWESFLNLGLAQGGVGQEGLTNASWRLVQQTPSATLGANWLGPLAGRRLELGDINLPDLPLVQNATAGAGVVFSNAPENFVSGLSDFALQGEAPPGWDIEVYRNGGLSSFATVPNTGRFRFDKLNLSSGLNEFRIVLYGPEGQREERTQTFRVGQGLVGQGEVVYSVGALAQSGPLIRASNAVAPEGGGTVVLNTTLGLTNALALNVGVAGGPLGSFTSSTVAGSAGLRAGLGPSFHQFDYATLADGSTGFAARSAVRMLDDIDLAAFITRPPQGRLHSGQLTESYGFEIADGVRLSSATAPVRYGLGYSFNQYLGAKPIERLSANQSWQLGRVNFSHALGLRVQEGNTGFEPGSLELSTRVANLPLRGNLTYQLRGEDFIQSAGLSTQVRLSEGVDETLLAIGLTAQPAAGQAGGTVGLQRRVGPLAVALNTSYQSNQTFQAGLNIGLALAGRDEANGWRVVDATREGFNLASADVRLFADDNGNGQPDTGEEMLAGVKVANLRTARTQTTNAQGVARFADLLPNADTAIRIDEDSLPDLYLRPAAATHILQAKTGYGGVVALPILRLGELAGQVQGLNGQQLAGLQLWLSDAPGATVQRTTPDEAGFFNFQPLPLGSYTLHTKPQQSAAITQPVVLTRATNVRDDLVVKFNLPTP
jgi:hypothetical protein